MANKIFFKMTGYLYTIPWDWDIYFPPRFLTTNTFKIRSDFTDKPWFIPGLVCPLRCNQIFIYLNSGSVSQTYSLTSQFQNLLKSQQTQTKQTKSCLQIDFCESACFYRCVISTHHVKITAVKGKEAESLKMNKWQWKK